MKVCYIWIEKYRNFNNFSLNLSSTMKFNYDYQLNTLIAKEHDYKLPNDFFGKNIAEITGIIGKNGAGKSNAIELVCKILKGAKTSLKTNFLFIVEESNSLKCYCSLNETDVPNSDFPISFEVYSGNMDNMKVVYFSNVFDERKNNFSQDISDISVNNLSWRNFSSRKNMLTSFQKQIKLINTKIFGLLNIETPNKIQFTIKVWRNNFNSSMQRSIYLENYEIIHKFRRFFRDRMRDASIHNKFVYLIIYGFFMDTMQHHFRYNQFKNENQDVLNFIESLLNIRSTEEVSHKIIAFLDSESQKLSRNEQSIFDISSHKDTSLEIISQQVNLLIELKESFKKYDLEYDTEGARDKSLEYFVFDYGSHSIKPFLNKMVDLFEDSNIFDINWLGISSGHKAYLNLFASLYQELRYTKQENLLLCIDEGDLYLHPKWQIEFFYKLLQVLPQIYNGNVQLILTSHSPFLLSDLPNSNITILDNGKSINGLDLRINTFGGNLYELYSEPFFLEDKRTSEFAFHKIKDLIYKVESDNLTREDKKEIRIINSIIGDEIIQYKINKILNND
ncbi:MAG: AAA family ATPase [Thiovulaceae bacterium]|nr:AAA family ATPase [Sulfurimonadaceae bacterium]